MPNLTYFESGRAFDISDFLIFAQDVLGSDLKNNNTRAITSDQFGTQTPLLQASGASVTSRSGERQKESFHLNFPVGLTG